MRGIDFRSDAICSQDYCRCCQSPQNVIPLRLTILQHRGKLGRNRMRVFHIIAQAIWNRPSSGQVSNCAQTLETLNERILILNERSVGVVNRSEEDYVDPFKAFEKIGALSRSQLESGSYVAQSGAGRGFAHDLHDRTGQALNA
jgi:hypothetical protein